MINYIDDDIKIESLESHIILLYFLEEPHYLYVSWNFDNTHCYINIPDECFRLQT